MKIKNQLMVAAVAVALCGCGEQKSANPLFSDFTAPFGIAPFEEITIDHFREGMLKGLEEQKAEIEAIINSTEVPTFENTIKVLDQGGELLRKVRGTFGPLSSGSATDETRALQKEMSPIFSAHNDDIYLNPTLFAKVKAVYDNKESFNLTKEEQTVLQNIYDRFVDGGALLSDAQKEELRKLNTELSMLQLQFGQNLTHETNKTFVTVDKVEELDGLPQANIEAAATMAEANGQPGKYMFNMQRPSCNPVLQYCHNRELREKVYNAYYNRGNVGNEYDNKEISRQIVTLRLKKANLMGYKNYAEMALKDRMAKTPEAVYNLLDQVWKPAVKKANEELADIRAEIKKEGKNFEPAGWDYAYYLDKAKKATNIYECTEIDNVSDSTCQYHFGLKILEIENIVAKDGSRKRISDVASGLLKLSDDIHKGGFSYTESFRNVLTSLFVDLCTKLSELPLTNVVSGVSEHFKKSLCCGIGLGVNSRVIKDLLGIGHSQKSRALLKCLVTDTGNLLDLRSRCEFSVLFSVFYDILCTCCIDTGNVRKERM